MDCVIYRCAKQAEMYLYVHVDQTLEELPEALRRRTGTLSEVMRLNLGPQSKLARVEVNQVLQALAEQGFFLQMPPHGRITARLYSGD